MSGGASIGPRRSSAWSSAGEFPPETAGHAILITRARSTRISLALSIARVFPPRDRRRNITIGMACVFGMAGLGIIIPANVFCSRPSSWMAPPATQCRLAQKVGIPMLCGTWSATPPPINEQPAACVPDDRLHAARITADLLLVAIPLRMLWRVRLPQQQRRLVLAGFTASTLSTLATVVSSVFQFSPISRGRPRMVLIIMTGNLEVRGAGRQRLLRWGRWH